LKTVDQDRMDNGKNGVTPSVSIVCITYKHEKYITEAIESFLMQKTNFPFEIIIGDDNSPDGTPAIIKQYEENYPGIVRAVRREKNIGLMANFLDCMSKVRGEYTALCEGDDYWTDPHKLQMQYEALQNHPECDLAFHDVDFVDENGQFMRRHSWGRSNEKWFTGVYAGKRIVSAAMTIPHTTSMFFRSKFFDPAYFDFLGKISAFDYPLTVTLCNAGDVYYIDKVMSGYRQHGATVSNSRSYGYNETLLAEILEAHRKMDEYYHQSFHKEIGMHLKGQLMMKYHSELNMSIDDGRIAGVIKSLLRMIMNHKNSQFSLRDIFWLFREKLKEKKSQ